jgi:cysteinyl-tRNA synthetase
MVDEAFGNIPVIDLHSGGFDLKFPHHDNEIAQSEAFYKNKQWINYFVHNGSVMSKGEKLSKSLKNFKTLRELLNHHSPRLVRLLFLHYNYDAPINYDPDTIWD